MQTNSDHSIEFRRGDEFRRSVEKAAVHQALERNLGILYPTQADYRVVELQGCGNCMRQFTRPSGSCIKYCGICIAEMKA